MRRLGRGIQMLRLGKRGVPMLRLGRSSPDGFITLEDLLGALEGEYYDQDGSYALPEESSHGRYRRAADPSQETVPGDSVFTGTQDSSADVKRSVGTDLVLPLQDDEEGYFDDEGEDDGGVLEKRPMSMLRLGKRPMSMLRLGKRPMSMLRLGKRPMSMLRLGKRPMSMLRLGKRPMSMLRLGKREGDGELVDDENLFEPVEEEGEFNAEKRPMSMLRLGKRPMSMLRLGKRPMNMLRLGKRPMNMLRLGKRPMNMLRLGKRPMNMLRLGKRPMNMLRLGKREAE